MHDKSCVAPGRCSICDRKLNDPLFPDLSMDCGGDCKVCMALAGDTDCERSLQTSYLNCIQELVERDEHYPWRVMVVCVMLNQTHGRQVRTMFGRFFEFWPRPIDFVMADGDQVRDLIAPLGFKNRRFLTLRRMTEDYLRNVPYEQCYGIGKYARDAIALFVHGRTDVEPFDTWLEPYLKWRRGGGPRLLWGNLREVA